MKWRHASRVLVGNGCDAAVPAHPQHVRYVHAPMQVSINLAEERAVTRTGTKGYMVSAGIGSDTGDDILLIV